MLEYLPSFERDVLSRLRLNATEAARICDITPRQLKYWTSKGYIPTIDDSEHCYDVSSLETAILIRRIVDEGYTLEMANRTVEKTLAGDSQHRRRPDNQSEEELRVEIAGYLEQLERRILNLREELPTYLALSKLGHVPLPLDARTLEKFFRENPFSFDTAPNVASRLGFAVEEVEKALEELERAAVLTRSRGESPVYRLRRTVDLAS